MPNTYVIDCEVYPNYFLLSAQNLADNSLLHFEQSPYHNLDRDALKFFLSDNLTISFNGLTYDLPMIAGVIKGYNNEQLKKLSDRLVQSEEPSWLICKDIDLVVPRTWDHIDIINVAPGVAGLKLYGGRLHQQKLQDLPIDIDTVLTRSQMDEVKRYCVNDLLTTRSLSSALKSEIDLRVQISKQYGMDVRSKGDAQIAEMLISHELTRITGKEYQRPSAAQKPFRYRDPGFIAFESPPLQTMLQHLLETDFTVGSNGSVIMPDWLKTPITVGDTPYQMGIGGLHSRETSQYIVCGGGMTLADYDVASYYPSIILQQRLAPAAMGKDFVEIYGSMVARRLAAKKTGDKTVADTFKIVLNSSFGKFGSKYSKLYSPDLLIQVTMTGQLALLMLIERLTLAGIRVVSANTDGIVLYYPNDRARDVAIIMFDWELTTSYLLEMTPYRLIASRDVNSYLAVKPDGQVKSKGCFAKPGLSKNPDLQIVYEAVIEVVATGTPIEETITGCKDICKFVSVRRVQGGAVWRSERLGRVVRFYYSSDVGNDEAITYATNGNRVPKSNGARPLMDLPDEFPGDVDYPIYITAARKLLKEIGFGEGGKC